MKLRTFIHFSVGFRKVYLQVISNVAKELDKIKGEDQGKDQAYLYSYLTTVSGTDMKRNNSCTAFLWENCQASQDGSGFS